MRNPFKKAETYLNRVVTSLKIKGYTGEISIPFILNCYAHNTPIRCVIFAYTHNQGIDEIKQRISEIDNLKIK